MRLEDGRGRGWLMVAIFGRAGRFPRVRASPDVLDAIFAPIDQAQQLSDLADFSSGQELGPDVCDLFKQSVDLFQTTAAPLMGCSSGLTPRPATQAINSLKSHPPTSFSPAARCGPTVLEMLANGTRPHLRPVVSHAGTYWSSHSSG